MKTLFINYHDEIIISLESNFRRFLFADLQTAEFRYAPFDALTSLMYRFSDKLILVFG
jgi:hypothetical protein